MRLAPYVLEVLRAAHENDRLALERATEQLRDAERNTEHARRRVDTLQRRRDELTAALEADMAARDDTARLSLFASDAAAARMNPEEPPAQPRREPLHLDVPRTDRDDRRR